MVCSFTNSAAAGGCFHSYQNFRSFQVKTQNVYVVNSVPLT